ncbi:hypothetical protein ACQRIU_006912 [Beauveria bassiana]
MSQSSDFEATNSVSPSPFILGPLTPASSTPEPSTPAEARAGRREEDRLFRHFRGYTWSQRSRNTKSWVWEYGFDIEKGSDRRWVCRVCIERNRPKPGNVISIGTQNAERHLWDHHKILDPSGKRSAPVSRKKPSMGYQTITTAFNLNPSVPREQAIANHIVKNFDKNVFQRLVVEWIVEGNLSFREPENKRLRDIFEYLNPLVASADAHISHDTSVMPSICREENKLDDQDWAVLEAFGNILQSFEDAVKALEGDGIQRRRKQGHFESYGNVWDVVVGYEFLLAELEKAKAKVLQYPEPEHFKVNINLAWKKLDEYYNKLDETPIYYTSLALHPAYRWGYFETVWSGRPAWVAKAKDIVQSVWDKEYMTLDISLGDEPAAKRPRTQYYSPFERYKDEARIHRCEEERDADKAEDDA